MNKLFDPIISQMIKMLGMILSLIKKTLFLVFNFIFFFNKIEFSTLLDLRDSNRSKSTKWFLFNVFLALFPIGFSVVIELLVNGPSKLFVFVNSGALPIMAFTLLASNNSYLIENYPESEVYPNIKNKVQVISIALLFISVFLFVFQSNFLQNFTQVHLKISLWASIVLFVYAISASKKMFLLQHKILLAYDEAFRKQMKNLNKKPEDDANFSF